MMELNIANLGFYALALVAIVASFRVIVHTNPVHAILSMVVSLLAVAGIFFYLGAPFAGVLEIIVYAGAILVLFVFVIMMLNLGSQNHQTEKQWMSSSDWAMPTCLMIVIASVMIGMIGGSSEGLGQINSEVVDAKAVGIHLFTQYVLLVEVAAFLLLGALVAAYHLGKKALDDENISHFQNQSITTNQGEDV